MPRIRARKVCRARRTDWFNGLTQKPAANKPGYYEVRHNPEINVHHNSAYKLTPSKSRYWDGQNWLAYEGGQKSRFGLHESHQWRGLTRRPNADRTKVILAKEVASSIPVPTARTAAERVPAPKVDRSKVTKAPKITPVRDRRAGLLAEDANRPKAPTPAGLTPAVVGWPFPTAINRGTAGA